MAFETLPRPTGIDWGSADRTYGQVKYGDDSQLVVLFYTKPVFNAHLSQQKGVRQYENQTWIKMHPPGEKLNIIDRPLEENDKRRFPNQWNMFLQQKTQIPDGTPIDLLFPNNPAVADNLRAFGVHTIQQCANLSAHALDSIGMGANDWKNMAKKYIDSATSGSAFIQMQAELTQQQQKYKILERQFEQLKQAHDDIMRKFGDPNAVKQPAWVPGFDVQAERLNANHPSVEIKSPPRDAIDQANIIKQVTEEDFPTVDVTKSTKKSDKKKNQDQGELDFGLGDK